MASSASENAVPRHWTSLGRHLGDLTHKKVVKRDGKRFTQAVKMHGQEHGQVSTNSRKPKHYNAC